MASQLRLEKKTTPMPPLDDNDDAESAIRFLQRRGMGTTYRGPPIAKLLHRGELVADRRW